MSISDLKARVASAIPADIALGWHVIALPADGRDPFMAAGPYEKSTTAFGRATRLMGDELNTYPVKVTEAQEIIYYGKDAVLMVRPRP